MLNIITGPKFDIRASHFCGEQTFPVTNNSFEVQKLVSLIPENFMLMTREELTPVVKSVMERMNYLWSSGPSGVTFPEKFGEYTKLSKRSYGIYMCGKGWMVEAYNGRYDEIMPLIQEKTKKLMNDKTLTHEQISEEMIEIHGRFATKIG